MDIFNWFVTVSSRVQKKTCRPKYSFLNGVYTGNVKTGSLENNEDPDEIQHNAAFH